MTATPAIAWITPGARLKLQRLARDRHMAAEELAGELITAALHAFKPSEPGSKDPPVLNRRALVAALRELPDE